MWEMCFPKLKWLSKNSLNLDFKMFALYWDSHISVKRTFSTLLQNGSFMYATMLDASKAIDKVNHSKLFGKLIDSGCPAFVVCILCHRYSSHKFTVRWCQGFSSFYCLKLCQTGWYRFPTFSWCVMQAS